MPMPSQGVWSDESESTVFSHVSTSNFSLSIVRSRGGVGDVSVAFVAFVVSRRELRNIVGPSWCPMMVDSGTMQPAGMGGVEDVEEDREESVRDSWSSESSKP